MHCVEELEPKWDSWPHICATCGELLEPTMRGGWGEIQWLHRDVGVAHAPEPRLLPPEE